MLRFWREFLILALSAACYVLYNNANTDLPPPVVTTTDHQLKEKEEKIQTVTTITKKPDGTITKKTVTTEKKTKVSQKESDKQVVPLPIGAASLTRYDVHVSRPFSFDGTSTDYQIGVGARIGNLPVFGTVDYRWKTRELFVGVRLEW